jgi:hypothetical protein
MFYFEFYILIIIYYINYKLKKKKSDKFKEN